MTELLDYSWSHPNLSQLKVLGITGVIRYVTGDMGKALTRAEIGQIKANGLTLTLVYETTGKTVKGGRDAGVADANAAKNALNALGLPLSRVYFAVDYDMQPAEYALLDAYLDGAASIMGKNHTGVYAGYAPCAREIGRGYAAWQTYAWSGGKVAQGIKIYQYQNGVTVAGGNVDRNRTSLSDYGQVNFGGAPASASTPAPNVKSLESLASAVQRGEYGNGDARRAKLGSLYNSVQLIVNERAKTITATQCHNGLAAEVRAGRLGNGDMRKAYLGSYYNAVQAIINGRAAASSASVTYTVHSGDTLSGIAAKYGTTWQNLQQINNIPNANKIFAGQVIRIK